MDLQALPAALSAARERVEALAVDLPPRAAAVVLSHTRPPRRTGRLAASGRVEADALVFGGGPVDYVLPVLAVNPFLARGQDAAAAELLDLTAAAVDTATTL